MKPLLCTLALLAALLPARADLTIVQKVEGGGPIANMTIKIKGNKVRVEATPEITSIIDSKTGEMINLINDKKTVMRISGEQAKAFAGEALKAVKSDPAAPKPKLTPTGKKETINGHETAEYIWQSPQFTASYWIATKYPDSANIVKQLQTLNSQSFAQSMGTGTPDFRDFPGVPLKTHVKMGGQEMTSTITALKTDALNETEFSVPKDYKDMKVSDFLGGQGSDAKSGAGAAPSPKP